MLKPRRKHTRKRAARVSQLARSKSNRGRRSKAHELKILKAHGSKLAKLLRSDPLREPVDPHFAPYYQQVLGGKARAILRYCDESWEEGNLSGSFYELVGRLFTHKYYKVADTILRDIEHRHVAGYPSKRRTYRYWYAKLKLMCERARAFIKVARKSNEQKKREQLWKEYVARPAWEIQNQQDSEHHNRRQQAIQSDLLQGPDSATEEATKQRSESGRLIRLVNAFGSYNLVPEEVFFDLALTSHGGGRRRLRFAPADVARKYACKIIGLSESTVSHWKS